MVCGVCVCVLIEACKNGHDAHFKILSKTVYKLYEWKTPSLALKKKKKKKPIEDFQSQFLSPGGWQLFLSPQWGEEATHAESHCNPLYSITE